MAGAQSDGGDACVELLADSVISLAERFLHNGGEPDANPSPEIAKRAIALLLRE